MFDGQPFKQSGFHMLERRQIIDHVQVKTQTLAGVDSHGSFEPGCLSQVLHETALSQFWLHKNSQRDKDRIGTTIPAGRRQRHVSLAAGCLHHAVYICRLQEGQVASYVEGRLAFLKSQFESLFQGVV